MSERSPFQDTTNLVVEALTLVRGERVLIRDLSFAAAPGDYVEIGGRNGAGKTSLLRALAGFLRPSAGVVRFAGVSEPALALHYIGHANGLKPAASVDAHLRYWAGLLGGAPSEAATLARLGLERHASLPARALSQGQARRLALARLLIAPRPIWLLDEPAAGLDEEGRAVLAQLIQSHRARGGLALAAVHEPLLGCAPALSLRVGD